MKTHWSEFTWCALRFGWDWARLPGPAGANAALNYSSRPDRNNPMAQPNILFCVQTFVGGGRHPGSPARGPAGPGAGRVLAVRQFSPLRRREGPPPLPPETGYLQKPCVLRCFLLFAFSNFSDLVARDGSTWANIGFKIGQHSLKMGQHSPQDGPT